MDVGPGYPASGPVDFDDLDLEWLRSKPGAKWHRYGRESLAAWVADMDFPPPPPVTAALRHLVDGGDLGYPDWLDGSPLRQLFATRMADRFGWPAGAEHVREVGNVVQGVQLALHLATSPGSRIALHTPCYRRFLETSSSMHRPILPIAAERTSGGWAFDHDRFEAALSAEPGRCRSLILCNPHNPTGHVFSLDELGRLAELAEAHDLLILSDEIHADLVYAPHRHVPIASLGPAVAARTVTLTSATKAFNLAGIRCGVVHVGPPALRAAWDAEPKHLYGIVSPIGVEATRSAWEECDEWLTAAVAHLDRNRARLGRLLGDRLPQVAYQPPDATYLAWLDFRALPLPDEPADIVRQGGVVLSPGQEFGPGGDGCARLNFATSAAVLEAIIDRMAAAVLSARPSPRPDHS